MCYKNTKNQNTTKSKLIELHIPTGYRMLLFYNRLGMPEILIVLQTHIISTEYNKSPKPIDFVTFITFLYSSTHARRDVPNPSGANIFVRDTL